jgi:FtsH-binding integral membrane protein
MTTNGMNAAALWPQLRADTGTVLGRTMGLVAATCGLFALGAYAAREAAPILSLVWVVAAVAALVGMRYAAERSAGLAMGLLFGFGALMGLGSAPAIRAYADADPQVLWQAGAATALFIAGFGAAGYATRRDLSVLARWLLWALVGLIVFGVVAIFVEIPNGSLIYALAGLAIFAGLTAYDFQRLRRSNGIEDAPLLAVSIFLDILNAFLFFLSIFGGPRD